MGRRQYTVAAAALIILAAALSSVPWLAPDWENIYRPGALSSRPNDVLGNYAPPWTYLVLWPIATLPDWLSKGALTVATVSICWTYMGSRSKFLILGASMPFVATLAFGQVDALGLVGLMVPASFSLLFLSAKPQGCYLAAINRRLTPKSVFLLAGSFLLSIVICGFWPRALLNRPTWGTDCSPWPWGIPVGLGLLWWQWKQERKSDAVLCLASTLLVPYFFYTSLLPATAAAIKELDRRLAIAVVLLTWGFLFVARIGL